MYRPICITDNKEFALFDKKIKQIFINKLDSSRIEHLYLTQEGDLYAYVYIMDM